MSVYGRPVLYIFSFYGTSLQPVCIIHPSPTLDLLAVVVDAHDADDNSPATCHHESSHRLVHLRGELGRHGVVQDTVRSHPSGA